jgi:hypothetical protein
MKKYGNGKERDGKLYCAAPSPCPCPKYKLFFVA